MDQLIRMQVPGDRRGTWLFTARIGSRVERTMKGTGRKMAGILRYNPTTLPKPHHAPNVGTASPDRQLSKRLPQIGDANPLLLAPDSKEHISDSTTSVNWSGRVPRLGQLSEMFPSAAHGASRVAPTGGLRCPICARRSAGCAIMSHRQRKMLGSCRGPHHVASHTGPSIAGMPTRGPRGKEVPP